MSTLFRRLFILVPVLVVFGSPIAAADVELHLHVLIAGAADAGAEPLPEELKEVVAALRPALAYKTYIPVATAVERVKDGARGFNWTGQAERIESFFDGPGRRPTTLRWRINAVNLDRSAAERVVARIDSFDFEASQVGAGTIASLRTDVSLKDGEKVVVGTSTLRDKGLILVLSARVVK